MKTFFDAAPGQSRNKQTEISVDYRLCYEAMGQGKDDEREYLADKYGRELRTIGQLNALAQGLFAQMDEESRAFDLYDVNRKLDQVGQDKGMDIA